jgi:hypothetical protein
MLFAVSAFTMSCSTSGSKQEPAIAHEGASRDLKGSVAETSSHVQDVFKEMGITVTNTEVNNQPQEQDLTGKAGDKTVSVKLTAIGDGMTHIDVSAKEGALQWNQDYAQSVLSRVIAKT